ncbi:hypothetical protein ACYSUW_13630 [Pseudomonas frederiksbergensis]
MNQTMNIATRTGTRDAALLTTFAHEIGGESFTFGVHLDLNYGQRYKVSEFSTGMGIADVLVASDRYAMKEDAFPEADILALSEKALQRLIATQGEDNVVEILSNNRSARPIINVTH